MLCINNKIVAYGNSSVQINATLLQGNQTAFREALAVELHRLHLIATQPLNFTDIIQRVDYLASVAGVNMSSNATSNGSNMNKTSKDAAVQHINHFIQAVNTKMNLTFVPLRLNASNFDIKLTVDFLESQLIGQSARNSTLILQSTVSSSIPSIQSTIHATSQEVYPSSCFISRFHCKTETNCPQQTANQPPSGHPTQTISPSMSTAPPNQQHSAKSVPLSLATVGTAKLNSTAIPGSVTVGTAKLNSTEAVVGTVKATSSVMGSSSSLAIVTPSPSASKDYCIYDCQGTS